MAQHLCLCFLGLRICRGTACRARRSYLARLSYAARPGIAILSSSFVGCRFAFLNCVLACPFVQRWPPVLLYRQKPLKLLQHRASVDWKFAVGCLRGRRCNSVPKFGWPVGENPGCDEPRSLIGPKGIAIPSETALGPTSDRFLGQSNDIYSTHVPSKFRANSLKRKERGPREVTHKTRSWKRGSA